MRLLKALSGRTRHLTRKRRLLSEADEILYSGSPEALNQEVISRAIASLRESKPLVNVQPKNTVLRDPEETVSWVQWYTGFQTAYHQGLSEETGHSLAVLLVIARDGYQFDVIFRMSKQGFGNIQYRLSVQKVEEDFFLCYEG